VCAPSIFIVSLVGLVLDVVDDVDDLALSVVCIYRPVVVVGAVVAAAVEVSFLYRNCTTFQLTLTHQLVVVVAGMKWEMKRKSIN